MGKAIVIPPISADTPASAGAGLRPLIAPGGAYPPGSAAGSAPRLVPAKTSKSPPKNRDRLLTRFQANQNGKPTQRDAGQLCFVPNVLKSIKRQSVNKKIRDNFCPDAHAGIHTRQGSDFGTGHTLVPYKGKPKIEILKPTGRTMIEFYTNGCKGKTAARYFRGTEIDDRGGWPGQRPPGGWRGAYRAPVIRLEAKGKRSSPQQNCAEGARMFASASCATIGAAGR
jgi:hypothetical protein